ncbi:hypothetical protein EXIGLDRAFT_248812 [Exidia glandulosa HHB12029]|uniref:Uncharacterized protein n=1 Tax=Exidia glandulosa HHB12029 TaxID=1314781 RepID=A0A165MFY0_EXIGL|nr:hypothetical protein EXIGLDRAFT_248812 [Exidia glandulosa HHB12029]
MISAHVFIVSCSAPDIQDHAPSYVPTSALNNCPRETFIHIRLTWPILRADVVFSVKRFSHHASTLPRACQGHSHPGTGIADHKALGRTHVATGRRSFSRAFLSMLCPSEEAIPRRRRYGQTCPAALRKPSVEKHFATPPRKGSGGMSPIKFDVSLP